MKEVTHLFNMYRECARGIWNNHFLNQMDKYDDFSICEGDFDLLHEFDEICVMLFSAIVLNPIGYTSRKKSPSYLHEAQEPLDFFLVVPDAESGVPIYVNREMKRSGYWDHPINFVTPSEVAMRFIDCYDFGVQEFRDFEYYLVRIVNSLNRSELIGRDALIQPSCARIYFDEQVIKEPR